MADWEKEYNDMREIALAGSASLNFELHQHKQTKEQLEKVAEKNKQLVEIANLARNYQKSRDYNARIALFNALNTYFGKSGERKEKTRHG